MVAGLLDWPQCTFAAELKFDGAACNGERETDAGTENISFPLPAVITTDLRLNTPRFATLPNIMKVFLVDYLFPGLLFIYIHLCGMMM